MEISLNGGEHSGWLNKGSWYKKDPWRHRRNSESEEWQYILSRSQHNLLAYMQLPPEGWRLFIRYYWKRQTAAPKCAKPRLCKYGIIPDRSFKLFITRVSAKHFFFIILGKISCLHNGATQVNEHSHKGNMFSLIIVWVKESFLASFVHLQLSQQSQSFHKTCLLQIPLTGPSLSFSLHN